MTSFFLGEQQTTELFLNQLEQLLGAQMADTLITLSNDAQRQSTGLIATVIATLLLVPVLLIPLPAELFFVKPIFAPPVFYGSKSTSTFKNSL